MTEKEKGIIKTELYKAYNELPSMVSENTKFVIAVEIGLERAQRKIKNNQE